MPANKLKFKQWLENQQDLTDTPQPDATKILYTAAVLHKYSQQTLVDTITKLMFETVGSGIPPNWIIRAHHMTIKYAPKQSDIEALKPLLGKEVELQVTYWAQDDHGIAVVVHPKTALPTTNAVNHITVAHSRDVGAVYSNTLLADKSKWIRSKNITLNSEIACVLRDNVTTIPVLINPASPSL